MPLEVYFPDDVARILESHQQADEQIKCRSGEISPELAAFFAGREIERITLAVAFGLLPGYLEGKE